MGRLHLNGTAPERIGWLRAAVLGANDGIVSTASLVSGWPLRRPPLRRTRGGYRRARRGRHVDGGRGNVSVHSQADTERADLARERGELDANPSRSSEDVHGLQRGLSPALAAEVARH